jgi:hypothetical protein
MIVDPDRRARLTFQPNPADPFTRVRATRDRSIKAGE